MTKKIPRGPSAEEMRARLRGYELPVKGRSADLEFRLALLDSYRAQYGQGDSQALISMTKPEIKSILDRLGVKSWKLGSKDAMLSVALRMFQRNEPAPIEPIRPPTYSVVWRNPISDRVELQGTKLPLSTATRRANHLSAMRWQDSDRLARIVGGDSGVETWVVREPNDYPPARELTTQEEKVAECLLLLRRLEDQSMGPALSGDTRTLAEINKNVARTEEKLRRAHAAASEVRRLDLGE